ncbi:MAG: hypothetical protein NTZ67_03020 [Gammaproteobacteria bacterium]|nr:hypothetical protein [Gammaproteobacteria bacterium]
MRNSKQQFFQAQSPKKELKSPSKEAAKGNTTPTKESEASRIAASLMNPK